MPSDMLRKVFFNNVVLYSLVLGVVQAQEAPVGSRQYPVPQIDYATYQTVDECLALFDRLKDSVEFMVSRDTLPWTSSELSETFHPVVTTAVSRCSEKFKAATIPLKDWYYTVQLFLISGRDSDTKTLIDRRLAAIERNDSAGLYERARILDSLITLYLTVPRPLRFAAADSIDHHLFTDTLLVEPWYERLERAHRILDHGQRFRDTTYVIRRAAERVVAIGESLTDADRQTREFTKSGAAMLFKAIRYLEREAILDSVRLGNMDSYYNMWKAHWERATKQTEFYPFPFGNLAPQLVGQWFDSTGNPITKPMQRPTRGKVSLVVFYEGNTWAYDRYNWGTFAVLRRLKAKFPELEINLVAAVPPAWFGPRAKADSIEEGAMYGKWLARFHKIPGDVVVHSREFWRLREPDRRAILEHPINLPAYRGQMGFDGSAIRAEGYLIGRDGRIVDWRTDGVYRGSEPDLEILIDALLRHAAPPSAEASASETRAKAENP
jgi:hypothetical protein